MPHASPKPFAQRLRALLVLLALGLAPTLSAMTLQASRPPFGLKGEPVEFIRNVAYGPDSSNRLDIFLPADAAARKQPTPLVVFIHGGGFSSGSKEKAYSRDNRDALATLLQHGIAYATIDYPLLARHEQQGLIKSLNGARRALQFLRLNRETFNIDPERIVLMGSSAGGSAALWLALHDDMADANSPDPLERQSTRVRAVVAIEVQATLDVVRWEEIFKEYRFTISRFEKAKTLYGIETLQQLNDPRIVQYRHEIDLLRLMDSADPEIWVANRNISAAAPRNASTLYHHPFHARALQQQAMRVGLKGQFHIPQMNIEPSEDESAVDFILRKVR